MKDEFESIVMGSKLPINTHEVAVERVLGGQILCVELWTGRYFSSTPEAVNEAIKAFNDFYRACGQASLNDLYTALGLMSTQIGIVFGWSRGNEDFQYSPEVIHFNTGWIKQDRKLVYFIEFDSEDDCPFAGWEQL